jgi:anti-sigma28 factor (negative regulator of flagellin synthesis)
MSIDRISNGALSQPRDVEHYQQLQKKQSAGNPAQEPVNTAGNKAAAGADQAAISDRAHQQLALSSLLEEGRMAAEQSPDVRSFKIAEVRQRLAEGFYQSAAVRDEVAGRLGKILFDQDLF